VQPTEDPTIGTLARPSGDVLALHRYPDDGAGPLAVILPAMGVPARYYKPFARELGAAGFAVTAVDLRGNGSSTPRPARATRYGYADLADDVGAVCDALEPRRAGRPLLLVGHSLGGQVGLIHAATSGRDLAGIALVAVGIPYWRAYPGRRRFGVLGMTQSIGAASAVLGVWPGWGFGGRQAGRVMTDWARTARTGRYGAAAEAGLARLTTPVLAVSVDGDTLVPAGVVDYLAGKLRAAPVERAHFTAADLGAPVNHFTWTRASQPIVERICEFTATVAGRGR
jgi:predicted alpha/beta hydrolase